MRMEVHLHADIPMLEGVSRKQIEQALAPLLEYLDAEGLADVKSLEQEEPGPSPATALAWPGLGC